jgi:hypothetical protein
MPGTVHTAHELADRPGPFRDGYNLARQTCDGQSQAVRETVYRELLNQQDREPFGSTKYQQLEGALAFLQHRHESNQPGARAAGHLD